MGDTIDNVSESSGFSCREIWLSHELAADYTEGQVRAGVRRGELHRVSRGVYTSRPPDDLLTLQALSRLVPGVVFTGRTAVFLHYGGPMSWPAEGIIAPEKRGKPRELLILRYRKVPAHRHSSGVRVVSPLQAAVDVLATEPTATDEMRRFLTTEYIGGKANDRLAADRMELTSGRSVIRSLVDGLETGLANDLERRALRLVRTALTDLPVTVEANILVGPYRFDLVIPEARVLIEIDSFRYHSAADRNGRRGFIRDRWKGNAAAEWDWLLFRYTDACVTRDGGVVEEIATQIRKVVSRRVNRRWSEIPDYPDPAVWLFHPQMQKSTLTWS